MNGQAILAAGILATLAVVAFASPVASQPPPLPSAFYGTFTVNGLPGPANLTVEAYIDGELRGSVVTHKAGWYGGAAANEPKLVVQGDASNEGAIVQFRIGSFNATTATWSSGTVQNVSLGAINDTQPPVAEAGPQQTIVVGQNITFDGSASSDDMGIARYHWDFGDGSSAEGPVVQHAYATSTTRTVTLTVTDAGGNNATDTTTARARGGGGGGPDPVPPEADPTDAEPAEPSDDSTGEPGDDGSAPDGGEGGDGGAVGAGSSLVQRGGSGIFLRGADGRILNGFDPLTGIVLVSSPDTESQMQWILVGDVETVLRQPGGGMAPMSSHEFAWDTREHGNGAYDLELRDGAEVLNTRRVVLDNPTIAAVELVSVAAAAAGTVAVVTGIVNAGYIALAQAGQEAAVTLSEDRLRTRFGGRARVWQRPLLFSSLSGAAALAFLALGFSTEGLQSVWSSAYLAQLRVIGSAAIAVFATAYLIEIAISLRAGLRVGIRFLAPGFISLVLSALLFRFPIGYPAYVADRPRDGEEELPHAWDALRNLAIIVAPLLLLLPLLWLRTHYYAFSDAAIEIVAIEVMVASLPFAPLPGAGVWRHRKSWSAILTAGTVCLFAALLLGSLGVVAFALLSLSAALVALLAQYALARRVAEPDSVAWIGRILAWELPGAAGKAATLGSRSVDAAVGLLMAGTTTVVRPVALATQRAVGAVRGKRGAQKDPPGSGPAG